MSEPTTSAGRALLHWADELRPFGSDEYVLSPSSVAHVEDAIDAIEREARAQGALHEGLAGDADIDRAVTRVLDALKADVYEHMDWRLPDGSLAIDRGRFDVLIEQHRPKGGPG